MFFKSVKRNINLVESNAKYRKFTLFSFWFTILVQKYILFQQLILKTKTHMDSLNQETFFKHLFLVILMIMAYRKFSWREKSFGKCP